MSLLLNDIIESAAERKFRIVFLRRLGATRTHMSQTTKALMLQKNIILIVSFFSLSLLMKRHITFPHRGDEWHSIKIVWLNYIFCAAEMFMILIWLCRLSSGDFSSSSFASFVRFLWLVRRPLLVKMKSLLRRKASRVSWREMWKWRKMFIYREGRKGAYKCFDENKQFPHFLLFFSGL